MRLRLILVVAGLAAAALPSAAVAADRGARVTVQRIQASGPRARPPSRPALPFHPTHPAALAAIKRRLARERQARVAGPFSAGGPKVSLFLNSGGLSAGESGGFTPPDTTGSIGPTAYVEMVNDAVAVFRRSNLTRVSGPVDLETFMQAPKNGTGTSDDTVISDPQIQWDQRGGRWFYAATAFVEDSVGNVTGPNYVVFGFSKTSDPVNLSASGWCHYSIASGGSSGNFQLDDYPKLGHDDLHLIFGSEVFTESGSDVATARIESVPKPGPGSLSSCPGMGSATRFGSTSSPLRTADGDKAGVPEPANTANASTAGYVVAADDPTEGDSQDNPKHQIMAWHVGGSAGSPVLVQDGNINVSTYDIPPSAFEGAGVSPTLDTLDARLTMAVAQRDFDTGREAVWTQHDIDTGSSNGPEPGMRWYELVPSTLTAQQGTISNPDPNIDDYNGAVSPNANGDFTLFHYNESSLTTPPEIRARARGAALSPGASTAERLLGGSSAPASDDSCAAGGGICRWGDYSGASPDQSNSTNVWGSNQAVGPPMGVDPSWTTRNFVLGDSPPTASFSLATTRVQAGRRTRFSGTAFDRDGHVVGFQWDLNGDGRFTDASGAVIHPVFSRLGTRTVSMRAIDDVGLPAVVRHRIRVVRPVRLLVAVRRHQREARVLAHRLPFRVRVNVRARVSARLVIGRRTAIRLGLLSRRSHRRFVTIGRKSFRVRGHRRTRARIRLRRRARRAIRLAHRNVVVQLRVQARNRAGDRSRLVKRRVVLIS